jgi:hypothetical protein
MALKVGGTTVINDSRALENISNLKTINSQSLLGSGDISIASLQADTSNTIVFRQSSEIMNVKQYANTGVMVHDFSEGSIWFHTNINNNFTANFTNVPTTNNRVISVSLILSQSAPAYIANAVQIDGVAQNIFWLSNYQPIGTTMNVDVLSFTLIRNSNTWRVLGSLTPYGY